MEVDDFGYRQQCRSLHVLKVIFDYLKVIEIENIICSCSEVILNNDIQRKIFIIIYNICIYVMFIYYIQYYDEEDIISLLTCSSPAAKSLVKQVNRLKKPSPRPRATQAVIQRRTVRREVCNIRYSARRRQADGRRHTVLLERGKPSP